MTVRDLILSLQNLDPTLEVYVSLTDENGDLLDAPASTPSVSIGRCFIGEAEED